MPASDGGGKAPAPAGACPDEATLVGFVDGRLDADARAAIEQHIDACATCAQQVFALADDLTGASAGASERAGRYVLGAVVGSGGMGVVREAFDPLLARKIAVKLIKEHEAEPPASSGGSDERATTATGSRTRIDRERLRDEARALAHLAHPNIVEVFDVGDRDGGVFLAMELVPGQCLRRWAEAAPRTWSEILGAYIPAAEALAAAHAVGIVHGDFKPDNVLRADDGRIKVVDFGLAQAAQAAEGQPADGPEQLREIFGTPAYLAPECWSDRQRTPASDQFAFFVSLFEALWAERPFVSPRRDHAELHAAMVAGRDAVPTTRAVPEALGDAVLRGLARRPRDRFPDMRAAIAALRSVADGERRRRSRMRLLVAAVAIVGGTGVALKVGQWREASAHAKVVAACHAEAETAGDAWNDEAKGRVAGAMASAAPKLGSATFERIAPRLDAHVVALEAAYAATCDATDEELATRRRSCLDGRSEGLRATIDVLADSETEVVVAAVQSVGTLPAISRCEDDAWLASEPPLPDDPQARAAVLQLRRDLMVAERLGATARNAAGLELARRVLTVAEALGDAPLIARAKLQVALRHADSGAWVEARDELEAAYFATLEQKDHESAARAATTLAPLVGKRLGRLEEGLEWCRHADTQLAAIAVPDGELAAMRDVGCAGLLVLANRSDEALAIASRGLQRRIDRFGEDHPLVAAAHSGVGVALESNGRFGEAIEHFATAREIFARSLGPTHPSVATTLSNMAAIEFSRGGFSAARRYATEALAIREAVLGPNHVDVATTLGNVASAAFADDDLEGAIRHFRRALAIREAAMPPNHPSIATALANLSIVLRAQGDCKEALALAARAASITDPAQPVAAISAALTLAEAHSACGEPERALAGFREVLAAAERLGASAQPELLRAEQGIGKVELVLGHPDRALLPLQSAVNKQLGSTRDPITLADAEFRLAQAVHGTGGSLPYVVGLGLAAHFTALSAGPRSATAATDIAAWVARISAPKPSR